MTKFLRCVRARRGAARAASVAICLSRCVCPICGRAACAVRRRPAWRWRRRACAAHKLPVSVRRAFFLRSAVALPPDHTPHPHAAAAPPRVSNKYLRATTFLLRASGAAHPSPLRSSCSQRCVSMAVMEKFPSEISSLWRRLSWPPPSTLRAMTCTQRAPRVSFSDKRAMQPCDSSPAMIRPVLVYAGVGGLLVVAGRQVRVVLRLAASRRARAQHFSRQPRGRQRSQIIKCLINQSRPQPTRTVCV